MDCRLLGSMLDRMEGSVFVAMVPWEWPAVGRRDGVRRVFDCADDWSQILPAHRTRMRELYVQIATEADAIICASERLAELFARRDVTIVRNGTPTTLLETAPVPRPGTGTMVYAGTLSERFDSRFVEATLQQLPEWRIDLYGPCQYAGRADGPDAELQSVLDGFSARAAWHGPVERDHLARLLDQGDVLVIPHRTRGAVGGGDAMKFYDYAARGRPVVTTPWTENIEDLLAPHTLVASTPAEFAQAVRNAAEERSEFATDRRRWAETNSWTTRWPDWAKTVCV
jgi:hypothetical protein